MNESNLPPEFIKSVSDHFGEVTSKKIVEGYARPPSVAVRINPNKPTSHFQDCMTIPWAPNGKLLAERPNFAHDPHFHAGAYYVQDASSMMLTAVLDQLELPQDPLCLDLCAAPGGKSTVVLDHLSGNGFLIANEIDGKRNNVLQENLLKWGATNVATTQVSVDRLSNLNGRIDLAVVDAPCSGEGMFRKDRFALDQWSLSLQDQCVMTQANILSATSSLIAEGGFLVYSTCTLNQKENEGQIKTLLNQGFELVELDLSAYSDFLVAAEEVSQILGYYLLPGVSLGEGLFISVLRKTEPSESKRRSKISSWKTVEDTLDFVDLKEGNGLIEEGSKIRLASGFNILEGIDIPTIRFGLEVGERKGKLVLPSHGSAMIKHGSDMIDLSLQQALSYLRRETLSLPSISERGWKMVSFEGIALGWVKVLDRRINNYYPTWLRLRT